MREVIALTNHTCCFFGHRTINETEELKTKLTKTIEKLITDEKVDTFLFGSKSRFDDLCLELVTEIKQKHPNIVRVFLFSRNRFNDEAPRAERVGATFARKYGE